jgi:hypothetical protein
MHARGWFPSSVFGPGVVGTVATLGAVAAGVAIVEAALIPGLLIGGAAVLAPRLLPRDLLSGLGDRLRRAAPSPAPVPSALPARSAEALASGEPASFDAWRAVVNLPQRPAHRTSRAQDSSAAAEAKDARPQGPSAWHGAIATSAAPPALTATGAKPFGRRTVSRTTQGGDLRTHRATIQALAGSERLARRADQV